MHLSQRLKSVVRHHLLFTFSTSPLKLLNGIQPNLTGSKISTSSAKFVFFRPIGKNKMAALASNWLSHFQLLLFVCVFLANRKNKMAALAPDRLRHFQLLLWNHLTEFNQTWQDARSQRPLPSLCFSGQLEKQDGRPGLWFDETFSTSPLKPLNGIQRNLTGS